MIQPVRSPPRPSPRTFPPLLRWCHSPALSLPGGLPASSTISKPTWHTLTASPRPYCPSKVGWVLWPAHQLHPPVPTGDLPLGLTSAPWAFSLTILIQNRFNFCKIHIPESPFHVIKGPFPGHPHLPRDMECNVSQTRLLNLLQVSFFQSQPPLLHISGSGNSPTPTPHYSDQTSTPHHL